jgi:hypothetical protein
MNIDIPISKVTTYDGDAWYFSPKLQKSSEQIENLYKSFPQINLK